MEETDRWEQDLKALLGRMAPYFRSRLGCERLAMYVRGLLSGVDRKNGWQLAEEAGEVTPYAMQQFLYRPGWDMDGVAREMRSYVVENLGDVDGVLVGDETGFLKKGTHSAGVQRQYSGTAGRLDNCQVGVFLAYVSRHGRAFLDRELYLPESWTDDRERCREAGVPDTVGFRTKPALLRGMLERAMAEGIPAGAVVADTVYGDNTKVREWLEERPIVYVLGTSINEAQVPISLHYRSIKAVLAALPVDGWQRLSAGEGSQGPRYYDWQLVELSVMPRRGWQRALLVRRSISDPTEVRAYRCFYPDGTTLATLVLLAGCRWTIETDIEEAKGEVGLDHYEVRKWGAWYGHITLALLAHAFLAVTKSKGAAAEPPAQKGGPKHQPKSTMAAFKASRGLSCP